MTRAARWTEIVLGAFLIVSAALKAVDMSAFAVQVSAYNVIKDPAAVRFAAYAAVTVETLLGAALVAGLRFRGLTHLLTAGMIVVYSTLIAYAWAFHGLEDCGCLGQWITMGPMTSLIKNIVLLAAIGFAWFGTRNLPAAPAVGVMSKAAAIIGVVLVLACGALDMGRPAPGESVLRTQGRTDEARPFAQFVFEADGEQFDLGRGEYLVAMLNATCSHCIASVPGLNELSETDGLPEMVALMMGDEQELEQFQATTMPFFPAKLIDTLKFMEFIGTAPPRLIYVHDGRIVRHWDWEDDVPESAIIAEFANNTE